MDASDYSPSLEPIDDHLFVAEVDVVIEALQDEF